LKLIDDLTINYGLTKNNSTISNIMTKVQYIYSENLRHFNADAV